jgi:hypothetical protein
MIWMRCRSTPGIACVPGSFTAHTAKRGLAVPRTSPTSPPMGVPVVYARSTKSVAPHVTPSRVPAKKRTTGRVPLVA